MKKEDVIEILKELIKTYENHIKSFSENHPYRKILEDKKNIYEICLALIQAIEVEKNV